jgi:hypothetical protein
MALSGTPATFYLSSEGEQALGVWTGKRSSFPALMISSDAIGAWILSPVSGEGSDATEAVMLVKWDYVATVTYEMSPEQAPTRPPIGFRPPG